MPKLGIRIRMKKKISPEDLRAMADIAEDTPDMGWNYNAITNKVDDIAEYKSFYKDGRTYHYRVNIGHEIITFHDITWLRLY